MGLLRRGPRGAALAAALSLVTLPAALAAGTGEPPWYKVCDQKGKCGVEQFAVSMPNKVVVLHVRFDPQPDGATRLLVSVPLAVALPPGIGLVLDGGKPITLPFKRCGSQGCAATAVLDKAAVNTIVSGKTLVVHYVVSDKVSADIPIRLEGLQDALKTLSP